MAFKFSGMGLGKDLYDFASGYLDPKPKDGSAQYKADVAAGNVAATDWKAKLDKERETYLQSLQGQADTLAGAPAKLAKQREEALQALRYNMAQSASQGRGLLGGGAGLASSRQYARERGVGEGETRSRFTQAEQEAMNAAAAGASEVSAERARMLELQRQDSNAVQETLAAIRAVKAGDASRADKVAELRAMRDAELDPRVRALYTTAISSGW
jgi:hypothetical protein